MNKVYGSDLHEGDYVKITLDGSVFLITAKREITATGIMWCKHGEQDEHQVLYPWNEFLQLTPADLAEHATHRQGIIHHIESQH